MPIGNDPVDPGQQSGGYDPSQLAQLQQFMGMGSPLGSTAGTGIDTGVPDTFRQQVDLSLRRKLGYRYQDLTPDQINQIALALWNETNGVMRQYYQQNPFPTSNQSIINSYLFSPRSPLPDVARQTIGMLPANEMTAEDRRFLSSAGGTTTLIQLAEMAGFQGDAALTIAAIAMAESGGNPNAHNPSGATGILQFMPETWQGLVDQGRASGDPTDPMSAFQAAYELSKGGTDFSDWETFTNGMYQQYMDPNLLGFPIAGYSQATGDISQNVPFPFNPMYFGQETAHWGENLGSFEPFVPSDEYGMPVGQPITTPVAGVIHIEINPNTWGRRVFVRTQGGWTFAVGHMGPGLQVTEGQVVQPGQMMGVSGGDPNDPEGLGGNSSGPHVDLQWINPQGEYTDPTNFLQSVFGGTTFAQLQSQYGGNLLGTGVATTEAQQERLMGYDPLLESIYGPIASALQSYLGRRPRGDEIRQVAQLGMDSDQLKQYINSLPSHISGLSYGSYQLLQQQGNSEFQKLFGYQIPDAMVQELFQKGIVTPSAISLYLAQHPANEVAQDPAGMNAAWGAASQYSSGIWNDQPHPLDISNLYAMAKQQGYSPPSHEGEQLAPSASPDVQKTISDYTAGVF